VRHKLQRAGLLKLLGQDRYFETFAAAIAARKDAATE
jgi:hypothetical protein